MGQHSFAYFFNEGINIHQLRIPVLYILLLKLASIVVVGADSLSEALTNRSLKC